MMNCMPDVEEAIDTGSVAAGEEGDYLIAVIEDGLEGGLLVRGEVGIGGFGGGA